MYLVPTMSLQRGWGQVGGELSAVSDHVQVRQRQMNYCEDGGARLGWTTDSSVAGLAWLNEDDFGCYCLPGTLLSENNLYSFLDGDG